MAYFAFNPIYHLISSPKKEVDVSISDGTHDFNFTVAVNGGTARLYLSRYFQLLFTDPENTRVIPSVELEVDGNNIEYRNVIWGSCSEEQLNDVGIGKKLHLRKFEGYPLICSVFNGTTFENVPLNTRKHIVTVDSSHSGYFLRWVDNMGQEFSWLFSVGTDSTKVADGQMIDRNDGHGMLEPDLNTPVSKTSSRVIKLCAVNLDPEELKVVKTITKSVIVKYLGKIDWIPCRVESGTFSHSLRDDMIDYEISIAIPDAQPQSL